MLYRNFRTPRGGEVDLVCRDRALNELVFVEVKTRSRAGEFGRPSDAVNRDKQRLIARGAMAWLRMLDDPGIVYRFDIVEIVFEAGLPQITVMKDAFQLPEPWRW